MGISKLRDRSLDVFSRCVYSMSLIFITLSPVIYSPLALLDHIRQALLDIRHKQDSTRIPTKELITPRKMDSIAGREVGAPPDEGASVCADASYSETTGVIGRPLISLLASG